MAKAPPRAVTAGPPPPAQPLVIVTPVIVFLGALIAVAALTYPSSPPDNLFLTVYLGVVAALVTFLMVAVEHGSLSMATIPLQAAAVLLNPRDTVIVALIAGVASLARRPSGLTMVAGRVYWTTVPELLRMSTLDQYPESVQLAGVVVTFTATNWIIVGLALSFARRESILTIWRRTFTRSWLWIIGYFALALLLLVHVLHGSLPGFGLATIVLVLSLALTDTVAARRAMALLQRQVDDADRHLLYSRAIEGVVHNLRNHLA